MNWRITSFLGRLLFLTVGSFVLACRGMAEMESLSIGTTEVSLVGVRSSDTTRGCLTDNLRQVIELYRAKKLSVVRTRLTNEHDVLVKAKKASHAIVTLGTDSPHHLFISIADNGHLIVPYDEWKSGNSYEWLSLPRESGISFDSCIS